MNDKRELDKRVSIEFFGEPFDPNASYPWDGIPPYSTNIVSAWNLWLEILRVERYWALGLSFQSHRPCVFDNGEYDFIAISEADSFEEAICHAALKAAKLHPKKVAQT